MQVVSQAFRYLFSFRPTGLPALPWTGLLLLTLLALAVAGQFADAIITYVLLTSENHWVIEGNPLIGYIISAYGFGGMLIAKGVVCVFIYCLVDSLRRRGFRVATYALVIASVLFGVLLSANGLEMLIH